MTVKLALLKSGETVITDIKELVDENEKVVSYLFREPYEVSFLSPTVLSEENGQQTQYSVSFKTWMPLSFDRDIPISPNWVVTIVEPVEMVKKSYEEKMNGRGNQFADGRDGGESNSSDIGVDEPININM